MTTTTTTTTTTTLPPPSPTPDPNIHITTSTSKPSYTRSVATLIEAFQTDAVYTYLVNAIPAGPKRDAVRSKLIELVVLDAWLRGAEIWGLTLGDDGKPAAGGEDTSAFDSTIVVLPPTTLSAHPPTVSPKSIIPLLRAGIIPALVRAGPRPYTIYNGRYIPQATACKKRVLHRDERYYYVAQVGTLSSRRGRGLCPMVMKGVLERAGREGTPVWLEASSEGSRRVYVRCGFRDVEGGEGILLGKGECGMDGERKEKGEGVRCWPMVWWPEGYVPMLEREGKAKGKRNGLKA